MAKNETTVPRIPNGPQFLCRMCGDISNHISGLCKAHREALTDADRAYLEWKCGRDEMREKAELDNQP